MTCDLPVVLRGAILLVAWSDIEVAARCLARAAAGCRVAAPGRYCRVSSRLPAPRCQKHSAGAAANAQSRRPAAGLPRCHLRGGAGRVGGARPAGDGEKPDGAAAAGAARQLETSRPGRIRSLASTTSATRTNKVMTSAVRNSPIAAAATMAIVIDSPMVMRRSTTFSKASLRIVLPPIRTPATPMMLTAGNGSQSRRQMLALFPKPQVDALKKSHLTCVTRARARSAEMLAKWEQVFYALGRHRIVVMSIRKSVVVGRGVPCSKSSDSGGKQGLKAGSP